MAAKKKKVTLSEFKAWLEGVEELQPKDWAPTAEQWKLIRDKIEYIVAPEPVAPKPQAKPQVAMQFPSAGHSNPAFIPPPPPVPGGVPAGPIVGSGAQPKVPGGLKQTESGALKTPDIDTSGGGYGSGFV